MNSSVKRSGRCGDQASILLIGSTGAGKSATINHLLSNAKVNKEAKTGSSKPETRETSEFVLTVEHQDKEHSNLTLGIIDTPGFNDRSDVNQDSNNFFSIERFFKMHPKYSACYPNLIFLLVSTNDDRIAGSSSDLTKLLETLKELAVVDQHCPNVVAILTHCCSISNKNLQKWEDKMQEKQKIISDNILRVLGIKAEVVLLENNYDDLNLETDGNYTVLPNEKSQPKNLYDVCQNVLEKNNDKNGLAAFKRCLVDSKSEKHCEIARHKVIAKDAGNKSKSGNADQVIGSTTNLLGRSDRICDRSYCWAAMIGVVVVVCVVVVIVVIVLVTT